MPQAVPVADPLAPGLYERLMTTSLTATVTELGWEHEYPTIRVWNQR